MLTYFITLRKENYGDRTLGNLIHIIKEKKDVYAKDSVDILIEENPFLVLILTSVMKRSHEQKWSSEICFVDSTGSCDQMQTCVTFILGAHKIGGVPLACFLHYGQTQEIYSHVFSTLRKYLPHGFGGNGYPAIFMTDDCSAERNALSKVFPESDLLLCSFHVSRAFCRWLCETKNGIEKIHRQSIMMSFRNIMNATSEIECELFYKTLLNDYKNNDALINYINSYWIKRREWCHNYRKELLTRGHNTNNYVEASIRIFKDLILHRCKAFNSVALLEFVVKILEAYHIRRILNHANSRVAHREILYNHYKNMASNLDVKEINKHTFNVTSSKDAHVLYTVHVERSYTYCDYFTGYGGAYCKYICAVEQKTGILSDSAPILTT